MDELNLTGENDASNHRILWYHVPCATYFSTKVTWIVLANQCLVFATLGRTKAYPRHLGQTWAFNLEPYQTDCE